MHVIILCGGSGERLRQYSFPKPLNFIHGKPAIYYSTKNLPPSFTTLHFIYSRHLIKYNFETIILNTIKDRCCKFYCLDYFTRGPIESAYLGILKANLSDEPILFLDNDNVYNFPASWNESSIKSAFVGCCTDSTGAENYSFINHVNNQVLKIKEKVRISDTYCIGVYGFVSVSQFCNIALEVLSGLKGKECYMSMMYEYMIQKSIPIEVIMFPNTSYHIGTYDEVSKNIQKLEKQHMRICFDLDNTLVSLPRIPGDYSSVEPIKSMIELVKKCKEDGHTIIIYTARRMQTHKHNIGAALKDIGLITFNTLEKFGIPYDEIVFGKPNADMYIDDKAINPYRGDFECLGLFLHKEKNEILNMSCSNNESTLELVNNSIKKSGPYSSLEGQLYYYKNIPKQASISKYFPVCLGAVVNTDTIELTLEYLKGIPLSFLYSQKLLTTDHIDRLLDILDELHSTILNLEKPSINSLIQHYQLKLKRRFSDTTIYKYKNTESILQLLEQSLSRYLSSEDVQIVDMIHGDYWLSNILLLFTGEYKLIDMRGKVGSDLTLGGDKMYDYCKLYQSILGYDQILLEKEVDVNYRNYLSDYYLKKLESRVKDVSVVKQMTFVLMYGTLVYVEESKREKVWCWLGKVYEELIPS